MGAKGRSLGTGKPKGGRLHLELQPRGRRKASRAAEASGGLGGSCVRPKSRSEETPKALQGTGLGFCPAEERAGCKGPRSPASLLPMGWFEFPETAGHLKDLSKTWSPGPWGALGPSPARDQERDRQKPGRQSQRWDERVSKEEESFRRARARKFRARTTRRGRREPARSVCGR